MKKTKTQAFANLIGSLIFIAVGVWACRCSRTCTPSKR